MADKTTFNDTYLAKWIEGEISDTQLKDLVSSDDFEAYKKLRSGVQLFEYLEAPTDATFVKINEKISQNKQPVKKSSKVRSLFTKSAIAIAASIALFFSVNIFLDSRDVLFESNFGETKTVALLDKSEVILNAKSTISYNKKNWSNKRDVKLNGEAFFKVQKGSTFTVITENGTISVLGTKFNVTSEKDFFEVTCYEGKVKVVLQNNEYILTPNKSVRLVNGSIKKETLNLSIKNPTWISGENNFRSVPLKVVIAALEKQFNITIKSNSIDDSIIFTGSFDTTNLEVALASVFKTTGINYQIEKKIIVLSK